MAADATTNNVDHSLRKSFREDAGVNSDRQQPVKSAPGNSGLEDHEALHVKESHTHFQGVSVAETRNKLAASIESTLGRLHRMVQGLLDC